VFAATRAAYAQAPAAPQEQQATPQTSPQAQQAAPESQPAATPESNAIALVPLDTTHPDRGAKVSGALEISGGNAIIQSSGEVTSGAETTQVTLPRRGVLRVCASTTVKLATDASVPAGETPGLVMGMDRGAVEASFATGRNADLVLTPDFRILISGPGAVEVKVRLGEHGDTCVDNPGADAPYVLVTSVFGDGAYRVQAGQRVMFEHGSLKDVIDNEKEPCGCPPTVASARSNEFPLAQSEGLAPLAKTAPSAPPTAPAQAVAAPPLVFKAPDAAAQAAPENTAPTQPAAPEAASAAAVQPATQRPAQEKKGFFHRLGHFFRRIFGAE
jgi:hypothetical protein